MVKRLHLLALMAAACVPGPLDETGKQCSELRPCGEGFICVDAVCQDVAFDAGLAPDAGADAGPDAGLDAGLDAGRVDAGVDAGVVDAGLTDAGRLDGGPSDAGLDAGPEDSGIPVDTNLLLNPGFELATADGGARSWRATTGALAAVPPGRTGQRAGRLTATSTSSPSMQSDPVNVTTSFGMLFCSEAWVRHDVDGGTSSVTMTIRDRYGDGGIDSSNGSSTQPPPGQWRRIREQWLSYGNSSVDVRFTTNRVDNTNSVLIDDVLLFRSSSASCVYP